MAVYPKIEGQKSAEDVAADVRQQRSKCSRSNAGQDFSSRNRLQRFLSPSPPQRVHPAARAQQSRTSRHSQVKRVFPDPSSSCASVFEYLYTGFALTHKGSSLEPLQRFSSPSTEVKNRMTPLSPPPALDICFLKPTFDTMECVVIGS